MVIADTLKDAEAVEGRIAAVFDAGSTRDRTQAVRSLFVEQLDLSPEWNKVSLAAVRGVELPGDAHHIASSEEVGIEILYVDLSEAEAGTNRIRKAEVDAAAKRIEQELGDDLLLVFTNRDADQLHLIRPAFDGARVTLRRMAVDRDLPRRTPCQQIAEIYREWRAPGKTLSRALDDAFNVESVTDRFFKEYDRFFKEAEGKIEGFGDDTEAKRVFTLTLFNRLMFVYFLSRKGWVTFRGDADYLNALWEDYRERNDEKNFYNERLAPLFDRLQNEHLMDLEKHNPVLFEKIGEPPFLNGGLFAERKPPGVTVPDEAVRPVIRELFARFNFTVMESTPYDVEVAVDPEMLGKVFEELVNERNKSGAYYTPRYVVSYMCREALKGYVSGQCPALAEDVVAAFVDAHDTERLPVAEAASIALALERVAVVDPACGSGAYLLGMMQELVDMHTGLYRAGVDAKSLYELKLHIIERNLYGVDLDGFAVNIAMLRLWLSLAIDYEGEVRDIPQLPNLDFKIVRGDSLLGPDPNPDDYGDMFRNAVREQADALARAKEQYFKATGSEKANAWHAVDEAERALREALTDDKPAPEGAVDWRIAFADVFAERGGFDVAIANPPYVQLEKDGGRLRHLYEDIGFATIASRGDLYQLFYERGCQLLRERGLLGYITSNSWLRAEYGKPLRRYFAEEHTPLLYLDLGKDVFESAIVDSGVLLLRKGAGAVPFPAADMDKMPDSGFPPPPELWRQVQPDGDSPWSILSVIEHSAMDKMRAKGMPLRKWDIRINYGIKTGYNKAFVIKDAIRESLIRQDPNSVEVIKPVLRGRDIQRYRAEWAGQWLIVAKYGSHRTLPSEFPAVYQHLLQYEDNLRARGQCQYSRSGSSSTEADYPGQHHWLELDNNPKNIYLDLFNQEKLLWIELADRGRFAYDSSSYLGEATTFIMTGHSLKYLCAVLNSSLVQWFLQQAAPTSGMGTLRWKKAYVETIPVPQLPTEDQRPFIAFVDEILEAKSANPDADTWNLETEIDDLVYDLYGLTEEERTAIERSLGLIHASDEEEDAALGRAIQESLQEGRGDNPEPDPEPESLHQMFERLRKSIPAEEWEKLPTDGAKNYKYYLYGHPKVED